MFNVLLPSLLNTS
jgi:hypothetical protein